MDVIRTGVSALDEILGGGVPKNTMTLIAGVPGAGKTILAEQIAVQQAKAGGRVLIFTALSESHESLLNTLRDFSFFDESLIGDRIQFISVQTVLHDGLNATAEAIMSTVRVQHATVVVLDGFRGIAGFATSPSDVRQFLYEVRSQLSLLGVTSFVTFETTLEQERDPGANTVADGIVVMHHTLAGVQARRHIEVQKLRGRKHLGGLHAMQITADGVMCYPRHEALFRDANHVVQDGRAEVGLPELNRMLDGGLNSGTCTLIAGNAGVGKTLIALHFLMAGVAVGEPGLYVGFGESASQLCAKAAFFGLDLEGAVERGAVELYIVAPVEMEVDVVAAGMRERVERLGIQRLVIDSVVELENAILEPNRAPNFFASLMNYTHARAVTTVLTRESAAVVGPDITLRQSIVTVLAENLLVLRVIEYRNRQYRTIAVAKMRQSAFDPTLHELRIERDRIRVLAPGESNRTVLDELADLNTPQVAR